MSYLSSAETMKWAQSYIFAKTPEKALKKRLQTFAHSQEKIYLDLLRESLLFAVQNKQEDNIIEQQNIPLPPAETEKGLIESRFLQEQFLNLEYACLFLAITNGKEAPKYQTAVNRTIRQAEQYSKQLIQDSNCKLETAVFLLSSLIYRVCYSCYGTYHPEETKQLKKAFWEQNELQHQLMNEAIDNRESADHQSIRQALEESSQKIETLSEAYQKNIYKLHQAEKIAIDFLFAFFPGASKSDIAKRHKSKGIPPSWMQIQDEDAFYLKLPQGAHTNQIAHNMSKKIVLEEQLDLFSRAVIENKDLTLYIQGYEELAKGANTSAVKLFDALVMEAGQQKNPLIRIPLKHYMSLRALKDEKEARKQIKQDLDILKRISFSFANAKQEWLDISLYGGRSGIYNGIIEFRFTPEFFASIPENQFMFIPMGYFATRDRYNPHTAYFMRRIAEHKRMNYGKANENIISIETLLSASPNFPSYANLQKGKEKVSEKIILPFERDMDAMDGINWHYLGQIPQNYKEFIESKIEVVWEKYPETRIKLKNK